MSADVTVLKALSLLTVIGAGVALGRSAGAIDKRRAALAVIAAGVLHVALTAALPLDAIERRVIGNSMAAMMTSMALLKTCGVWLPIALVPWSDVRTRAWIAAFVIGAAVMGEVTFYFPFEVIVFNGVEETPEHPGLLVLLLFCAILAAPGFWYLVGSRVGGNPRDPVPRY